MSESKGGVLCSFIRAELSQSVAPGKISWKLNFVLFRDTHFFTHTVWPLAEGTLFSCLFLAHGEFIHADLTEFSVSSIISLPMLLVFLLFCMFIYENHVMFVFKNCLRL